LGSNYHYAGFYAIFAPVKNLTIEYFPLNMGPKGGGEAKKRCPIAGKGFQKTVVDKPDIQG
jgi:hypothetical protein